MKKLGILSLTCLAVSIIILLAIPDCRAQSPGDTVGWTQYVVQAGGPTGNRIAVDSQGWVHFTWTRGNVYPSQRRVSYGYLGPAGYGSTDVSYRYGDGFAQIALAAADRAAIVYHNAVSNDSLFYAVDSYTGLGIFDYYHPPNRRDSAHFMWPYLTIDRHGRVHLVATGYNVGPGDPRILGYTVSENGGTSWVPVHAIDTLLTVSCVIASSPVSEKVAMAYAHQTDTLSSIKNNVYYLQAPHGFDWDFRNGKVNITHYGQGGDSLYATGDLDLIYDYNDDLHITWNAQWVTPRGPSDRVFLYDYNVSSGVINEVTRLDVPDVDSCLLERPPITMMSLGASGDGTRLYVVYSRFEITDCSADSFANGDVYGQFSSDGGSSWSGPRNLTWSHTPGCDTGQCASDIWPSLAEKADDYLHISFVCQTRGSENAVLYLAFPVNGLSVQEPAILPHEFRLSQNYPNPFNSSTRLDFALARDSDVRLEVFDITGAKVAVLADERMRAGAHSLVWDADGVASGVYYYRLTTDGGSQVKKMTLLK